jgi:cation diffusion facilitator CzcD-associated flavoprotein CzcO
VQPETERYLNYVADKFDLRRNIQLHAYVTSVVWDTDANCWQVNLEDGQQARAQFVITAVGSLHPRLRRPRQLPGHLVSHRALAG